MKEERKEILEETLEEFSKYRVDIDGWIYKMGFTTKFYDEKTGKQTKTIAQDENVDGNQDIVLEVRNPSLFFETMDTYVEEKKRFFEENLRLYTYDDVYLDGKEDLQEKQIMTTVFSNASFQDFKDPISFLKRQIAFLKNNHLENTNVVIPLDECFLGSKLHYKVEAQHPKMETPYVFRSMIENDSNEVYHFPSISFGVQDGKCYIYAIQDSENHTRTDAYYKKIKRSLYKVNKNVMEDDSTLEKITDVSPSSICALACFFGWMHQNGIEEYEVIPYLPMRYQAKNIIISEKIKKLKDLLEMSPSEVKDSIQEEMESFYQAQDQLQMNITNKFVRNFLRMNHHFDTMHITSYPNELDDSLHFTLAPIQKEKSQDFVQALYQQVYQKKPPEVIR